MTGVETIFNRQLRRYRRGPRRRAASGEIYKSFPRGIKTRCLSHTRGLARDQSGASIDINDRL